LREELIARLHGLNGVDAAARLEALEIFSVEQTPRITELEKKAEALRLRLIDRGPLRNGAPSDAQRQWKLDSGVLRGKRDEYPILEYQVIRAAAFYHEGLSLEQRWHLRETTMEMEAAIFHAGETQTGTAGFMFFMPGTSRIRLPADLPAALAAQVQIFSAEKAALKKELRDKVYDVDKTRFPAPRKHALEAFAHAQAGRFESLEEMAEDIRRGLAALPQFSRRAPPVELSEDLARRIAAVQQQEYEQQRAWLDYFWRGRFKSGDRQAVSWREPELQECASLCAELAKAGVMAPLADGANARHALTATLRARNIEEGLFLYFEAALEPGLSPPQRRLLFGAAMELFDLPLPGGEGTPVALPGTVTR
jgi:hypothetical protein